MSMLDRLISGFSDNLDGLREFVELIGPFLREKELEKVREHAADLAPLLIAMAKLDPGLLPDAKIAEIATGAEGPGAKVEVTEDEEGKKTATITIPSAGRGALQRALQSWTRSQRQTELLYRSSLITLVSTTESFLSDVLHFYFERFPDAVGTKDNVFSLDDLKALGSIEDARNYLIDLRVENILRGSFTDWMEFLNSKIKLSLGYLEVREKQMAEVYQRRNLFVHNGGIVNSIYLSKVDTELAKTAEAGKPIRVPPKYLENAINDFETAFVLVAAELWKKLEPSNGNRATLLISLAFTHLQRERWAIAEGLSFFTMQDKKLPERDRMMAQLNYWQSLKWSERYDEISAEIRDADFSAKEALLQLARFALMDSDDEFFELLPTVLASKKISPDDLAAWPIFRRVRKDERLQRFLAPEAPPLRPTEAEAPPAAPKRRSTRSRRGT